MVPTRRLVDPARRVGPCVDVDGPASLRPDALEPDGAGFCRRGVPGRDVGSPSTWPTGTGRRVLTVRLPPNLPVPPVAPMSAHNVERLPSLELPQELQSTDELEVNEDVVWWMTGLAVTVASELAA